MSPSQPNSISQCYYLPILPLCEVALYSNPIISLNPSCLSLAKAFVRMSATIYCVGQYSNSTILFSIFSLMKWCCTSMCFDLSWLVGFLANAIEPWLSHMMVVASSWTQPKSSINCRSQMASLVQRFMAMYSASIVDCATVCCRLLFHETAPSPTKENVPRRGPTVFDISGPIRIQISFDVDMLASNAQLHV